MFNWIPVGVIRMAGKILLVTDLVFMVNGKVKRTV